MATDGSVSSPAPLAPDEAFALLGNEMRMEILQVLGEADGPMTFTELRDRVGIRQGGQFNYHLDKLVGHFVAKTDDGYSIGRPGRRIIEAVLSGAVTDDPVIDRTGIDFACLLCNAPIEVCFQQERLELYCTECAGQYGDSLGQRESITTDRRGYLGQFPLPAAGIDGRTPEEVLDAASLWAHLELLAAANGVCPRCSAVVDRSVHVCEDHDASEGLCPTCDQRHEVTIENRCTNCVYEIQGIAVIQLISNPDLRSFVAERGIDPLAQGVKWGWEYDENVHSAEPFEATFTFAIDGDGITLRVDDEFEVVDVTRSQAV